MFILLISILIALIIVIFAVQNAAVIPVQFLLWSTNLPLVLVIFCSVFAGALLMFCLALWRELKKRIVKRPKNNMKSVKSNEKDPIDISEITQKSKDKDDLTKNTTNENNGKMEMNK